MRLTLLDRLALPRGLKAVANAVILSLIVSAPLIGSSDDNSGFIAIAASGGHHSFAIAKDGKVYATGGNVDGQLGLGYKTNRDTFIEAKDLSDKNISAVALGHFHSFALTNGGKVYAAGDNEYGQLGIGDSWDRRAFTEIAALSDKNISAIAAGSIHSLALSKDGKVYATGGNVDGQLGLGYSGFKARRRTFTEVKDLSDKNISALAAGWRHSLALAKDGKVYAAGHNYYGQLGLGDDGYKADRNVFVEIDSLNGKNIIAIAAGDRHSFAIAKDGRIYAAGDNEYGQLGLGDSGNKTNRKIFTEVKGLNAKNIIAIDAGSYHSLALAKDGKVYAAGHNYFAGLGEVTVRGVFTEITNLSDKNITAIAAGGYHSLALSKDGRIYAAGYNKYGQLGLGGSGEETDRHTFTLVPIK